MTEVTYEDAGPDGSTTPLGQLELSEVLRLRTSGVHRFAERSGIIADILAGKASDFGYALFLRNLLPVYESLEVAGGSGPAVAPELCRAGTIKADLAAIGHGGWWQDLPLLPVASEYAERIAACRNGDGALMLAHAYVRYLGDLSGGQVMMRLLARSRQLQPHQLSFYAFPAITDVPAYKAAYRRSLDAISLAPTRKIAVAEEAVRAFEFNIALSIEAQRADYARSESVARW